MQRRGRAYQCRRCGKIDRRYRLADHYLKEHVSLDRVPFYCSLCSFRAQDKQTLYNHINSYKGHREEEQRRGVVDLTQFLRIGRDPISLDESHMAKLSKEDSEVFFNKHAKQTQSWERGDLTSSSGSRIPAWLLSDEPVSPTVSEYVPTPIQELVAKPVAHKLGVRACKGTRQIIPSPMGSAFAENIFSEGTSDSFNMTARGAHSQAMRNARAQVSSAMLSPIEATRAREGPRVATANILAGAAAAAEIFPTEEDLEDPLMQTSLDYEDDCCSTGPVLKDILMGKDKGVQICKTTTAEASTQTTSEPSNQELLEAIKKISQIAEESLKVASKAKHDITSTLDEIRRVERKVTNIYRQVIPATQPPEDHPRKRQSVNSIVKKVNK